MNGFFVVKGELAAWALGLDPDEGVPPEAPPPRQIKVPRPPRRKRRLGHEWYRHPGLRRADVPAR